MFLAEGIRQVTALLSSEYETETLFIAPDLLTSASAWEIVADYRTRGGECLNLSREVFASISTRDHPQGMNCVARSRIEDLSQVRPAHGSTWVALMTPQDPGNVGTILRTCDAVGASGIILLDGGVDPYHPTAIRAATGATFSQSIAAASTGEFVEWAKSHGMRLIGTSDAAESDYRDHSQFDDSPRAVVMGSERQGIPESVVPRLDRLVRIPMVGMCDSLNLAVATSIILYELTGSR
jgi:TrmH family RNA methyltransferase